MGYEKRPVEVQEKKASLVDQQNFQYRQMLQRAKSTQNASSIITNTQNPHYYSSVKQKQRRRLIQAQGTPVFVPPAGDLEAVQNCQGYICEPFKSTFGQRSHSNSKKASATILARRASA